jgi:23S rRNA (cytosine1962-C5)-methyltransferase
VRNTSAVLCIKSDFAEGCLSPLQACQLVAPGGLFVTCSCSGMLGAGDFERIVTTAAHRQHKRMQIFDRTGAGPDHPTLSNYPESRYLKVLWSRVV